jgi:hypothetical protein
MAPDIPKSTCGGSACKVCRARAVGGVAAALLGGEEAAGGRSSGGKGSSETQSASLWSYMASKAEVGRHAE